MAVVGVLGSAIPAWATAPPHALVQAIDHTNSAQTEQLSLVEKVMYGGTTQATVHLSGVEEHGTIGSFAFSSTPATAGLSSAHEIVSGSKAYIHYPVLDKLHATDSRVKPWILVDTSSSLGVEPGVARRAPHRRAEEHERAEARRHRLLGGATVTRYTGTLSMRKNASSPEMQNLFAHLPSASAVVLDGTEKVEFDVGADGYLHRFTSVITVPVRGSGTLRIDLALSFGKFNAQRAALTEPDAGNVMTLEQFDQIMGASGTADADSELVHKVSLAPGQVGSGYVLSQIPGGQLVTGEVTLDFCGCEVPERVAPHRPLPGRVRQAGRRVQRLERGRRLQARRNEESSGEVTRAVTACKQGTVKAPAGSAAKQFVRHTTLIHDPRLPKGTIAILDIDSAVVKGKKQTGYTMEIYQVRGNILSAVYGFGPSAAVVQAKTLKLAEQSAATEEERRAEQRAHRRSSRSPIFPPMRLAVALIVAIAINAFALWVANALWTGVSISGAGSYILAAAVLGFANAVLKPILTILTLPLVIVTLGFFYLLINIAMVALAEWITPNFSVDGFWDYVGLVFIIWLVNWACRSLIDAGFDRTPKTTVVG